MITLLKATDIKWAFNKALSGNLGQGFIENLCLFIGEIIRSDEIGLIVHRRQPILMLRICKVDFQTEETHIEIINFKDSRLREMIVDLKFNDNEPAIICSGVEIFCYRSKPDNPYHPKMHPTYRRAREKASRILDSIFLMVKDSSTNAFVSFVQVDQKNAMKFFKRLSNEAQEQDVLNGFETAITTWMTEFYTDSVASNKYRTKNRYPLTTKPLESATLSVITTDDDGNLIGYKVEV